MPDLTSTLLAMYQQIIGGSSAREQSSLEAEAARRVLLSGLTINGSGTLLLPGTVVLGAVSVASLGVTGTASVTGTLTVGGNATVGGTLGVTGTSTFTGAMTGNSDLTVAGTAAMGALACTGVATITGTLTQNGPLNLNNLLTVGGFGAHIFSAPGAGNFTLQVRNLQTGTANVAGIWIGNDTSATLGLLQVFASTFTPAGVNQPNALSVLSTGVGGLSVGAIGLSGVARFYSGGAIERARFTGTGELCVNLTATLAGAKIALGFDGTTSIGIAIQSTNAVGAAAAFLSFVNASAVAQGSITGVSTTGTAYNTTSDARLKIDLGRAIDLAALRSVIVHDFFWKSDRLADHADRGVFAQEAHALFPRAVTPGTDEQTETGALAHPWMTDYSKFVPDLIVGYQQHENALRLLRAELQQLLQMTTYAKYQS